MILCCGEALIDMLPARCGTGETGFVPHGGGAVFNTAIALGRLGLPVSLFTGLSDDLFGKQLEAALQASHVQTTHAVRSNRPTPLAFVELNDGKASYTFYDEGSTVRMLTTADLPELTGDVDALYFSGISLCRNPVGDAMRALCEQASPDRVVILDPNIRPGFVDDINAYRARLTAMLAHADIVKLSDEDLDWMVPEPDSLDAKLDRIMEAGVTLAILTRGHLGSTAVTAAGATGSATVPNVKVVDTVGAGDTFNAGFIACLVERGALTKEALKALTSDDLDDALAFAAKVAAVTVSRAGANPPWRDELHSGHG